MEPNTIMTSSGRLFDLAEPTPEQVHIEDIAHALSNTCRFSGHVRSFYSVAQHCVLVSLHCDLEDALWGLLHDAAEAYLIDMPTPVKRALSVYGYWETQIQRIVCEKFGLHPDMPPSVQHADGRLLATEARDLCHPNWSTLLAHHQPLDARIEPWTPAQAKRLFLFRFRLLVDAAKGYRSGDAQPEEKTGGAMAGSDVCCF